MWGCYYVSILYYAFLFCYFLSRFYEGSLCHWTNTPYISLLFTLVSCLIQGLVLFLFYFEENRLFPPTGIFCLVHFHVFLTFHYQTLILFRRLHAELFSFTYIMSKSNCNIMAEGFRFMPLGLVRLRTFRLSTWIS